MKSLPAVSNVKSFATQDAGQLCSQPDRQRNIPDYIDPYVSNVDKISSITSLRPIIITILQFKKLFLLFFYKKQHLFLLSSKRMDKHPSTVHSELVLSEFSFGYR